MDARSWLWPWQRSRVVRKMRDDWEQRARENSRYYIANCQTTWSDEEFFRSGEMTVQADILTDMVNVCQGKDAGKMTVFELGCGAGRLTRALAKVFGEVHGVDISPEMIRQAREALRDFPNAHVHLNSGADLSQFAPATFDFAYCVSVFHHIPRRQIIERYLREVNRILRPGCLFKFEVQGYPDIERSGADDTWLGASFTERQAVEMAVRSGFDPRYRIGEGQENFWLWFFKWPDEKRRA
ncbi:MAG TPA: class I SAM-dependent methyltransferase [Bryobacteraceae bacterium]|nr:class I SAM-dependent methyltransferase [Bryobacteraceae bacterium]